MSRGAGKARSPGSEGAPARKRAGATRQEETANDQLKTHLRGPGRILRSRLPELVHQEEQCLKPVDVDDREGRTFPVIE